jgi:hypothetical protein
MANRRFPMGELNGPGAGNGRDPAEEAAAEETLEDLTMAAILKRVDAALNEASDRPLGPGDHASTGEGTQDGPRYEVREEADGWQVADLLTGFVAEVDGLVLARLSARRASSLADVLNRADLRERHSGGSV